MDNSYQFDISNNVFNVFSRQELKDMLTKYNIKKYCYLNQIHSTIVNIVDDNYQNNSEGDAMITNLHCVALVIRTADCIPIVLYDKNKKVIAAIHSGWKGTLNNIVKEVITKMKEIYQVNPQNIEAYLYPSIRKCHFEVDEDVYLEFKNKIVNIDKYNTKKGNKYYLDLQSIVIDSLKDCGVTNIQDSFTCTYCSHDKYHSYRYKHTDKRNNLIAMIKE